jgi:hypothetical protein
MIEERIRRTPPPSFDKYYREIKQKSLDLRRDDRRINLPVLISHLKPQRY